MIIRVHARGALVVAAIRRAYAARAVTDPAPQLVAAWAGSGELADLEPAPRPGGYDTTRLAALLAEPMRAGATTPTRPVWRCTLELDPTERRLTHQEWAAAVRDLLDEAGLAPHGDRNAVRWIAIAHGHARVDVVATLVRQDGRTEPASDDRHRCAHATRNLEHRLGLATPPPGPDTTTPGTPRAAATRRAAPPSARERLRRQVRSAAVVATDEDDFVHRLRAAGLRVRLRRSRADNSVTGYAVSRPALPGRDHPPWFGGGQLAPDLTLTHLRARWAQTPRPSETSTPTTAEQRQHLWQETADAITNAADDLARPAQPLSAQAAHAVADILTATAITVPQPQAHRLAHAAELLHRAIGGRRETPLPAVDARAVHLRSLARLVGLMGQLSSDRTGAVALQLVYLLAGFADNLAALRQSQQRRSQAAAASTAAARLHASAGRHGRPPATPAPDQPLPVAPLRSARPSARSRSR
ncbi:hypothetical protein [Micromonospora sp. WMMD1082]|uniref:hypothetical protein n=1 Tax=Micromonospora sp. WMMD1082 TaxID=3016104 RepID=UPI002416E812|nr:hypothetical protein [Micromonospora sp. WMMD1082]MDG4793132.1 hypothetical protein [Micromonospora sp. WMMD1082]